MKLNNLVNVFFSWIGMAAAIVYAFFMTPITVHGLGDTYYGIWNLVMSCVGYMAVLDFGIQSSVNRYMAKYKGLGDENGVCTIYSNAIAVYLAISLIALIAGVVIAFNLEKIFQINPSDQHLTRKVMILMAIYTAIEFPCNVYGAMIYAYQRFGALNGIKSVMLGVQAAVVWYLLKHEADLWSFALAIVGCGLLKYLTQFLYTHWLLKGLRFRLSLLSKQTLFQLLTFSSVTFLAIIVSYIIFKTDNIVIGIFLSPQAITLYAIGFTMSDYAAQIIGNMCNTFTPLFSEHEARGEVQQLNTLLLVSSRFSTLIGIPVGLAAIVIGKPFITLWMGPSYQDAYLVMVLLMIARMAGFPTASMYSMLYGIGKHYIALYTGIFEAVMNIILSLLLVHKYGILGVAMGTVIPMVLANLFFPVIVLRSVGLSIGEWIKKSIAKPALFCVLFYVIIYYVCRQFEQISWKNMIAQMVLITAIYWVLFFLFGLKSKERQAVLAKFKLA